MKYVVLGSSAAGINGIRELRKLDKESEIILISKDREIYSRCILHQYLGGERNIEQLCFVETNFEHCYQVKWIKGKACVGLKRQEKQVLLEDGTVQYAKEQANFEFKKVDIENAGRIVQLKITDQNGRTGGRLAVITDDGVTHIIEFE